MQDLNFTVKDITLTPDFGEFAIEPLAPGYGYTIGHALRRVLYTSISGAAVTSVKINGVKHRFSTVPGLKENVVDFLLNIKELSLRLPDEQNSGIIRLSIRGAKEITAEDLEVEGGVEVVNKDQYLGTLSGDKSRLEVEMTVERGFSYALLEEKKAATLGVIPTDAIFTPIKRVTYAVEATRVGRQTNLDKLIIKIWTNGAVAPRVALDEASKTLASYFLQIYQPKAAIVEEKAAQTSSIPQETLHMTIDELDLPTRIYNSLRNGGVETVEQLLTTPRKDLISMRNMGGKSIMVIEEKLRQKGVSLTV